MVEDGPRSRRSLAKLLNLTNDLPQTSSAGFTPLLNVGRKLGTTQSIALDGHPGKFRGLLHKWGRSGDEIEVWVACTWMVEYGVQGLLFLTNERHMPGNVPQLIAPIDEN